MKKLSIKDRAKELYIQRNEQGEKKYSNNTISEMLAHEGYKKVTRKTVGKWALTPNKITGETWNTIISKIKQQSIEKAVDDNFTAEEQLIEKESDKLAETYKNAEQLEKIGFKVAFDIYTKQGMSTKKTESDNNDFKLINFRDALSAVKLGNDIKFRILEVPGNNVGAKQYILSDEQLDTITKKYETEI